jgi:ZIP family zinc transporter
MRSAGMIVHSMLDGVAIGLGFHASPELGLLVGIAVLTHDFADGMNVVTLAFAAGHGVWPARIALALDAVAPAFGVAIGSLIPLSPQALGALLAAFAGVVLAIGAGHLLPEAQHRRPGGAPYLVLVAAIGAGIVLAIQSFLGD